MNSHRLRSRRFVSRVGLHIAIFSFVAPIVAAQWPCGQGYVLVEHDSYNNIGIGNLPANGPVCDGTPQNYAGGEVSIDGGFVTGFGTYRTVKSLPFVPCQTNYLNQITITFGAPQQKVFLTLMGKDGELTVSPNVGGATIVTVAGGNGSASLVGDGISTVTISTTDQDWDFQVSFMAWDFCVPDPFATPTPTPSPREGENDGATECNSRAGEPINVTNGNMYLQETDYQLPGAGELINITRTYNSNSQRINLFGRGWSSQYDQSIQIISSELIRLNLPDGRAVYFEPTGTSGLFAPLEPDFRALLTANASEGFTLALKDGKIRQFNSSGQVVLLQDLNGNQTVLNYSGGGLQSIVDPFGRALTVATDPNGRVLSISDSIGTVATYSYSQDQELLSVVYADGSGYQFSYHVESSKLLLATVTDALGNILESHTYDSQGRAITSEKANGVERYTLDYVSPTKTRVTDALGRVTTHQFLTIHGRNVVTRVAGICACGGASQIQTWNYDDQLNLIREVDGLGHRWEYRYDLNGNRTGQEDYSGLLGFTNYTYNQYGQMLTKNHSFGGETTFTYDAAGNLLSQTNALGHTTSFTYDIRGQLLTVTDPRGKVTTLTWDTNGRLTQVKDALNHTTNFASDPRARLTSVTNAANETTSYIYEAADRLKRVTHPDNSFVEFTYDLAGRRTELKDERGNITTFGYDTAYHLTSETDAANQTIGYSYDAMSNVTEITDQLGRATSYEYDGFGQLKKVIYPAATPGATRLFSSLAYDAVGNVTLRTDTAGRVTSYVFDKASRLKSTTNPDNKTTGYEYDALSRVTATVDALGQRYEFEYDELGRVTGMTRAGVSMSYAYDAAGNRTARTDYNGATTDYAYDDLNRLTTIVYPDSTSATYSYDALSRLTTAANENGTVSLSYDNRNRLTSTTDVFGKTIGYSYDANGNRTGMTLNGSAYAGYAYDMLNRLTQLSESSAVAVTYAYDAVSKPASRTLLNGVVSTYEYDGLDRLSRLRDVKGTTSVLDNQYAYNAAGQIVEKTTPDTTQNFAYDVVDRLSSVVSDGLPSESYTYDAVGNRTSSSWAGEWTYDSFNRLAHIGLRSYSYDNNGNLIQGPFCQTCLAGSPESHATYSYDFENRLTQVVEAWRGAMFIWHYTTINYQYDALGRRIGRSTSNGQVQRLVYDGQDVIQDIDGNGQVITSYLNGPGIDNKIRQTNGNGNLYYAIDHLGSTRALTADDGSLVEQIDYDSFGNSSGSSLTRYTYTGREMDPDTGLMYYRARWYDPQVGRFISEDPIGFSGGVNFYSYVGNNSINFRDPSGLCPQNPAEQQTPCEQKLAGMFGGPDARIRTRYDSNGVYRGEDPLAALTASGRVARNGMPSSFDPNWDSEHLYNSPHLTGNLAGTANTDIYVPGNYQGQPTRPSPTAGVVLIYYPRLGDLSNVTLAIYHVGNFGVTRHGDRVRIGTTGGPGGRDAGNFHSHFEIWNGQHRDVVDGPARFARRVYPFTSTFCP